MTKWLKEEEGNVAHSTGSEAARMTSECIDRRILRHAVANSQNAPMSTKAYPSSGNQRPAHMVSFTKTVIVQIAETSTFAIVSRENHMDFGVA